MNDVDLMLTLIALFGLLGLLVIVFILHRTQREMIRDHAAAQTAMDTRVKNLEEQFLALPLTQKRMKDTVSDSIKPLNTRLDATDVKIAEISDMLSRVANKMGA